MISFRTSSNCAGDKTRKEHLLVGIKGASESAKEFVEAWRHTERGERFERPIERLLLRGPLNDAEGF